MTKRKDRTDVKVPAAKRGCKSLESHFTALLQSSSKFIKAPLIASFSLTDK